jgi:hypothetical protein
MLPVIATTPTSGKSMATTELVPAANNICIDASRPPPMPATSPSGSSAPCAALGATIPNEAVVSVSRGRKLHRDMNRISVRMTSAEVQQAAVMTQPRRSHLMPTPRCANLPLSVAPATMPAPVQANSSAK